MANSFRGMWDIIYPPSQFCPRWGRQGHKGVKIPLVGIEYTNFVKLQMPVMHFCKFYCWETGDKEAYDLGNSTDSDCLLKEQIFTSGFDLHGFRRIESYHHGGTVQHETQKFDFL